VNENVKHSAGAVSFAYRIGGDGRVAPGTLASCGEASRIAAIVPAMVAALPDWYVQSTFASIPCAMATETGGPETREQTRASIRELHPLGLRDIFVLNAIDPTRGGVYVGAPVLRDTTLAPAARRTWMRIAAHVAAAARLRRALTAPEAILSPSGRVEHAEGDARPASARARLGDGARAIDRARGKLRRSDPDQAVAEWRGLIAARWTLVETFESDGKRYLLARRNEADPVGMASLTARERQVVGFAALKHRNKLIAYELGLSPSTVGVLLHRAARKLGVRTRDELIAAFLAETKR
jgi:DNA-binding CsgD family transcriptional regulator